jgi:autotransporter strand-loop-strand O-heptosyltransferase
MKIIQVNLGLLPIPPNGWGAIEKIIWEYYNKLNQNGLECEIKYLNEIVYNDNIIVHVHVANLANECYIRGIPYIFTLHDHHAYLYGKESVVYKENLKAIENSVISTCPAKYLVNYFDNKKLRYFPHAVNVDQFINKEYTKEKNKLLCVANNGYANNQSYDRKGFKYAIEAAKELNLPITIAGPSNNKKFFENLDPELNNYEKLNKLFDLNETELIELYNNHGIFIHASELEAGHPNLTLLEAMSCGLPVIGTFEEKSFDGMIVVNRNVEEIKNSINKILLNYNDYKVKALESAKNNSYNVRIKELINLYDDYSERLFALNHINVYESINENDKNLKTNAVFSKPVFKYSFNDNAKIEVDNPVDGDQSFHVTFYNKEDNSIKYETDLKHGWWGSCNFTYYIPYEIQIKDNNTNKLIEIFNFNLKNKKVLVEYDSFSLGDQLAWMPIIEQFRKKHECDLYVKLPLSDIFEKKYPDIKFIKNNSVSDLYATYKLGFYVDNNGANRDRCKTDPRKQPLQKIASDYLGLPYVPETPLLDFPIKERPINKKYVTIATQSTCQSKYWNYKDGWEKVIKYLNSKNYEVICIDKHRIYGNGNDCVNVIPKNAIDYTGDNPLTERMNQIYHSEFFIGLPSGLSWLAWAIKKPVVLISGFSHPYTEFETPYRVQNHTVCTGCWNDSLFDKGNWKWCPKTEKKEEFECTKSITPEMVIEAINQLLVDNKIN